MSVRPPIEFWWAIARWTLPLLLLAIEAATLAPWSHLAGLLLLSSASRPPVGAPHGMPPLVPDTVLLGALTLAMSLGWLASGRPPTHDTTLVFPTGSPITALLRRSGLFIPTPWRRRITTAFAVVAVGSGAVLSLQTYGGPTPGPASGWFGAMTAGHEAGALLFTVGLVGVAWWRGTSVGTGSPGDRHAGRRALVGGTSIAIASAVATAVKTSLLSGVIPVAAFVAIPAMIGALALASLEEAHLPAIRGTAGTTPDRAWLGMVVALCIGTAVIGAIIALLLSGQASVVVLVLRAVGGVIGAIVVFVASIAVIPVLWFAEWLTRMMTGRGEPAPDLGLSGLGRQAFLDRFEEVEPQPVLDPATTEIVLAVCALVLVGLIVWRLMRPSTPPDIDGAESEERSSILSWASLFGNHAPRPKPSGDKGADLDAVRRAYRGFLEEIARHGMRRLPNETPDRLRARLSRNAPGVSGETEVEPISNDDLDSLTRSYEAVRYGDAPPDQLATVATATAGRLMSAVRKPR